MSRQWSLLLSLIVAVSAVTAPPPLLPTTTSTCPTSCSLTIDDPLAYIWMDWGMWGIVNSQFHYPTITPITIVNVVNTVSNTTSTSTVLNFPPEWPQPDTNADGTRVQTIEYTRRGIVSTTTITYPEDFVVWPDEYTWDGVLSTTSECLTAATPIAAPIMSNPQRAPNTVCCGDYMGWGKYLVRTGSGTGSLLSFPENQALFPDQAAFHDCRGAGSGGPDFVAWSGVSWSTATTTSYERAAPSTPKPEMSTPRQPEPSTSPQTGPSPPRDTSVSSLSQTEPSIPHEAESSSSNVPSSPNGPASSDSPSSPNGGPSSPGEGSSPGTGPSGLGGGPSPLQGGSGLSDPPKPYNPNLTTIVYVDQGITRTGMFSVIPPPGQPRETTSYATIILTSEGVARTTTSAVVRQVGEPPERLTTIMYTDGGVARTGTFAVVPTSQPVERTSFATLVLTSNGVTRTTTSAVVVPVQSAIPETTSYTVVTYTAYGIARTTTSAIVITPMQSHSPGATGPADPPVSSTTSDGNSSGWKDTSSVFALWGCIALSVGLILGVHW